MLTVKLVYKRSNVPDDLKWTSSTHMTPFTLIFKAQITISMVLDELLCSFFYPSTTFLPVQMTGGQVSA